MWPLVWPGQSKTFTSRPAQLKVSPPDTAISMPGIFSASFLGPMILQPNSSLSLQVSGDMVFVVVGGENMGELPAKFPELRLHRLGIGRVNRGGGPGFGIMDDDAIVVGAAHELAHIEMGHIIC